MNNKLIRFYMILALVASASNCIGMEGCPEDTPPTTPRATTPAAQTAAVDTRWVDVRAYEGSFLASLYSGTTVHLVPHKKGVIDVRHGPGFCPQSLVDFIEQQVAKVGTPLQRQLAAMDVQSDVRQALEGAYARFIDPLIQRHTEAVRQLAALGVEARQEGRVFYAANTFSRDLTEAERTDALRLSMMFSNGVFPDPRVHLESSNALLRAARLVELQTPCPMLNVINAR